MAKKVGLDEQRRRGCDVDGHPVYPTGTWWHVTTAACPGATPYATCDTHREATIAADRARSEGHTNVTITTSRPRGH